MRLGKLSFEGEELAKKTLYLELRDEIQMLVGGRYIEVLDSWGDGSDGTIVVVDLGCSELYPLLKNGLPADGFKLLGTVHDEIIPSDVRPDPVLATVLWVVFAILGLVVVLGVCFLRCCDKEHKPFVLMTAYLSTMDLITDIFFAMTLGPFSVFTTPAVILLVLPAVLNVLFVFWFLLKEAGQYPVMHTWLNDRPLQVTIVALLSLGNAEVLCLLCSRIWFLDVFSAPFTDHGREQLRYVGLLTNIFEDIPQIIIQIMALGSRSDAGRTFTLVSIIFSVVAVLFGLVQRCIVCCLKAAPNTEVQLSDREAPTKGK
jgi:hypothetical protein